MTASRFLFDLLILAIFIAAIYSFIFLPRQMQFRRSQNFVTKDLKPGDEVVTYGGMIGTVQAVDIEAGIVTLEIASGIAIRVISTAIASPYIPEMIAENARKGRR